MPDNNDNQNQFELVDAALRRNVPPQEPLSAQLHARIVASFRTSVRAPRAVLRFPRFALAGAIAAGVLLAIVLLVTNRPEVKPLAPIAKEPAADVFEDISPASAIVDPLAAVEDFATDSVVQEIRYLAGDASQIGSAMLASLPDDVVGAGQSGWLSRLLEK